MIAIEWSPGQIGLWVFFAATFYYLSGRWYFNRTHGTGKIVFLIFSLLLAGVLYRYPASLTIAWFLFLTIWYLSNRGANRKEPFAPVVVKVEGGGIKRGLTAPEASVLLGSPLNKTVLAIIFGLLQKSVMRVEGTSPFKASIVSGYRTRGSSLDAEERHRLRMAAAGQENIVLRPYEELVLELLEGSGGAAITSIDFSILLIPLVEIVGERAAGYDIEESVDYYWAIIRRAPKEARLDGALETDSKKVFERNLLWVLLHDDFREILDGDGREYLPRWLDCQLGDGKGFGAWVEEILAEMRETETIEGSNFRLRGNMDELATKLASDIARATYYS